MKFMAQTCDSLHNQPTNQPSDQINWFCWARNQNFHANEKWMLLKQQQNVDRFKSFFEDYHICVFFSFR